MKTVLGLIVASGLVLNTTGQAFANPTCDAVRTESVRVDIEISKTVAYYPFVTILFAATLKALENTDNAGEVIGTLAVGMTTCAIFSGSENCQAFAQKIMELAYRKEAITKLSRQHHCGIG